MLNSRSPTPTAVDAGRALGAAPALPADARAADAAASRPAGQSARARVMSIASAPDRRRLNVLVGQLDALDRLVLDRPVIGAGLGPFDRIDGIHALGHPAEHGVLAVEPRRGLGRDDEELRAVRIRARVRHCQGTTLDLVLVELVLEGVPGAAGARALRAAALDHEVRDHAVEDEPVVEPVGRELAEVLDG